MTGDPERDQGKELYGIVRAVNLQSPTLVSLEMLGGHHVSLNGWESGITTNGEELNNINQWLAVGDIIKVILKKDHKG